ncbi:MULTISPECIES: hypothetical protein [unclassified Sphingomonas]|uniref:hypothetical protein n=1 Tax=unclassified Sphingomonas TaxID=196159 RepID=UPI0006F7F89B|nr:MULTISPECIES: hypothetical protein [unclassified Sphingomonas]KQM65455.1 hypothetical protein ASE65_15505 [Sphingomonas sp. Leaf16]KQN17057.1 hypothetical protein ASE83_15485 [Sphingomonas sp. Leaf32]KQN17230.1 hypothetical protein ASE81_15550 [Sphingomonas sp. Leaf29]
MTPARGRPLRFLALVTVGWVGMRVALLWPEGLPPEHWVRIVLPSGQGDQIAKPVTPSGRDTATVSQPRERRIAGRPVLALEHMPTIASGLRIETTPVAPDPGRVQLALLALVGFTSAEPVERAAAPILSPPVPPETGPRMTVSLWALARPGAASGGPVQLGGGQAGIRVRMPVTPDGRAAVAGRIATPLVGQGREAALGVEWRPLPAPVAMVVERRVALNRGRSGTGMGLIAGIDRGLPGHLAVEAYGQAGAVARDGIEPYADGAARLLHPVATIGRSAIRLGIGGWGGAQREGARLDIGPSAVAALPVGRGTVRLSLDWRQRIGGTAAPGSGPALTIGSDF